MTDPTNKASMSATPPTGGGGAAGAYGGGPGGGSMLPILERRAEIEELVRGHQVVVICGETGSGKTTQLPRICFEMGLAKSGVIGHTQPRRLAARAVAARIAEERGESLGGVVGVKVRFNDQTGRQTRIKVMTDGILLAELANDPELRAYSTIIIDEAHERSLNIDFLLGYLKTLLPRRADLKLIVTSATIDPKRFSEFFGGAPVIEVSGRMYPVEVRYQPTSADDENFDRVEFEAVADAVEDLCAKARGRGPGDVLVFLPGEREIRLAGDAITRRGVGAAVLPLYSRLTDQQQDQIFHPGRDGKRRVILSTNVAETSLTVPGIRYVVDTGLARISRYDPAKKVGRLPVEPISQASANQRAGRCGRVAAGVCVRLYGEESWKQRARFTDPEIRRTSLANVILQMKSLGLGSIEAFPFLDKPDSAAVKDGYETLFELGAIDVAGAEGRLTEIGRRMSRVPLDVRIARMLLGGEAEGVLGEVLVLAAVLSIQDPRERPMGKQEEADRAQSVFRHESSDFLTLLKLWDQYEHTAEGMGGGVAGWCRQHFVSPARMREWTELVRQLRGVADDLELGGRGGEATAEKVHRALLTGLISNVACREGDGSFDYRGVRGNVVQIFPGSVLFKKGPKWIMAAEVVQTTRLYARTVARVEPEWIEELAGHMFRHQVSDAHLDAKTGEPSAWERVSMSGIVVVPRRQTALAPLDAKAARKIFVREALAEAKWETDAGFMVHNRRVLEAARSVEAKVRRRDVIVGVDRLVEWFEARVPANVVDAGTFGAWVAEAGEEKLKLSLRGVVKDGVSVEASAFPDEMEIGLRGDAETRRVGLTYAFAQGKDEDGVTATVELVDLPELAAERAAWLVPGMSGQVVAGLMKTLPKGVRSGLEKHGKLEELAEACAEVMAFGKGSIGAALSEAVEVLYGVTIDAGAWAVGGLPPHLRLRVRVVDEEGAEVAADRDVAGLQKKLAAKVQKARAAVRRVATERHGIITWDFGALPDDVAVSANSGAGADEAAGSFAALIDKGESVSLTRVSSARQAGALTQLGLRRLFALAVREEAVYYVEALPEWEEMSKWHSQLGTPVELRENIIAITAGRVFMEGQAPVRTKVAFEERLQNGSGRLAVATREVGEAIAKVLEPRFLVAKRLSGGTPRIWAESVADIREQAAYLLARGFLRVLWWERLRHYPRYVGTMWERLLAMREEGRDANLTPLKVIVPHWKRYTGWVATAMNEERRAAEAVEEKAAPTMGKGKPALPQARRAAPTVNTDAGEWAMEPGRLPGAVDQYRWAIEELRVAMLAPQLNSSGAGGTSAAELDRLWAAVQAL